MYNSVSLLYWIHAVIERGKISCSCRVIQLQNIDNCHNHYNKPGGYHFVGFYNHLLVEHLAALRICIGKRSHVLKFGYVWFAAHATITTLHVPLLLHSGIVCLSLNSWWYTPSCELSPSHTSPKIAHPFGKANSCISHISTLHGCYYYTLHSLCWGKELSNRSNHSWTIPQSSHTTHRWGCHFQNNSKN